MRTRDPLLEVTRRTASLERWADRVKRFGFRILDVADDGAVNFGSKTRQMLNLYGNRRSTTSSFTDGDDATYGIGVQGGTLYQRSNLNFAWFRGGRHADGTFDPGSGGELAMTLQSDGRLNFYDVNGDLRGYVFPDDNTAGDVWLHSGGRLILRSTSGVYHALIYSGMTGAYYRLVPLAWTGITLTSGWSNASGKQAAQVRYGVGDKIEIRGVITGGTITTGTAIFTLPTGMRPPASINIPLGVAIGGSAIAGEARLRIEPTGVAYIHNVQNNTEISFLGEFSTSA